MKLLEITCPTCCCRGPYEANDMRPAMGGGQGWVGVDGGVSGSGAIGRVDAVPDVVLLCKWCGRVIATGLILQEIWKSL